MNASGFFFIFFFSLFFSPAANSALSENSGQAGNLRNYYSFSSSGGKHAKSKKPNHIVARIKKILQRSKRITAAILAFPLPFGILALHRIYMGTRPFVPVVYIGTIGGVLGILPFIDFCVLLLDSNVDRYYSNGKVFMWIN